MGSPLVHLEFWITCCQNLLDIFLHEFFYCFQEIKCIKSVCLEKNSTISVSLCKGHPLWSNMDAAFLPHAWRKLFISAIDRWIVDRFGISSDDYDEYGGSGRQNMATKMIRLCIVQGFIPACSAGKIVKMMVEFHLTRNE